jgi:hypothetical protein
MDRKTLAEVEDRLLKAVEELPEGGDWFAGMFDAIKVVREMVKESK